MKDEKIGQIDPEDIPSAGSSTGDDLPKVSTDAKGKQKAGLGSAASQLGASAKLVVNAMTTLRELPNLTSDYKSSSGSSNLATFSSIADEYSSRKTPQGSLFGHGQKAANECQDGLFDKFTKYSTDMVANDGHHINVSGSSFAVQEASDGLAVLELLSQPGDESLETSLYQQHGSPAVNEDELWNEAAFGTPSDQEDRLDFTPDFITRPELSQQAAPYLGTGNIQETSRTWLEYWSDVFTTYNARVWGNAHPMPNSEISRQDIEQENGNSEPATINRALSRLKLIFYHLKG
ncbi:hypothetical protein V8C42DRAFT_331854 [Trichoderma barbatum]